MIPALLLAPLLDIGKSLIDRLFPDKIAQEKERAAAELELFRLTQGERMAEMEADLQLNIAQLKVNEAEAANPSLFVSGWRPFIGWTCGLTFLYSYLLGPMIVQLTTFYGHPYPIPEIDMNNMIYILGGMLGLGGLRTFEKIKGVASK